MRYRPTSAFAQLHVEPLRHWRLLPHVLPVQQGWPISPQVRLTSDVRSVLASPLPAAASAAASDASALASAPVVPAVPLPAVPLVPAALVVPPAPAAASGLSVVPPP